MTNTDTRSRAIIMGATSGIGLEVARVLAGRGWTLGIAGRRVERLKAVKGLKELIEETGGMDLYFHSSGIGWQNVELDTEKEMRTVETNVVGFTRMVTAAFHHFAEDSGFAEDGDFEGNKSFAESKKKGGHIAVISSIAGTKGLGAAPAYSSTKRYQNHYIECLEQQARMRGLNIRFTDIRPGFVATDLIKDGNYPLKLRADDVAKMIVKAIEKKKAVATIDWRYRLLVFFWRMIPRCVWKRLKIK